MIKHASETPPPSSQPSRVQTIQQETSLAPELAVMADALKAALNQITGAKLPENSGEQQEALAQLRTTMTSTLQPILGTSQAGAKTYGPITPPGHSIRDETAPYQETAPASGAGSQAK